jgi:hypothetical protein
MTAGSGSVRAGPLGASLALMSMEPIAPHADFRRGLALPLALRRAAAAGAWSSRW